MECHNKVKMNEYSIFFLHGMLLTEWGISDKIVAVCFETTASNSGRFNGLLVLLEHLLERSLFYLPCRHHICELYLRAAFESSASSLCLNYFK